LLTVLDYFSESLEKYEDEPARIQRIDDLKTNLDGLNWLGVVSKLLMRDMSYLEMYRNNVAGTTIPPDIIAYVKAPTDKLKQYLLGKITLTRMPALFLRQPVVFRVKQEIDGKKTDRPVNNAKVKGGIYEKKKMLIAYRKFKSSKKMPSENTIDLFYGKYKFTATAEGFEPKNLDQALDLDIPFQIYEKKPEILNRTIYLVPKKGSLVVTLKDKAKDQIVKDAEVTITAQESQFTGTKTLIKGDDGKFRIKLIHGQYKLEVNAKGYSEPGEDKLLVNIDFEERRRGATPGVFTKTIKLQPVENRPEVKVGFVKAGSSSGSKLMLTLTAPELPLKPDTLKVLLEGKTLKLENIISSNEDKTLKAEHIFQESQTPGTHQLKLEVTDQIDMKYELTASFDYDVGLVLEDYTLDDTGGFPEDGKANTGETVKIALKLKSFEPGPIKDLTITCPTGDSRLKPSKGNVWNLASIPSGKSVTTPDLLFEAGEVKRDSETVELTLTAALGNKPLDQPMSLKVPVYSSLELSVNMDPVTDHKQEGTPNNGDGKAQPGESVKLLFRVTNEDSRASAGYKLLFSCQSPSFSLEQAEAKGDPLAANGSKEFAIPAKVAEDLKEKTTVTIIVELKPDGTNKAKIFEFPVILEPMPLEIRLLGIRVDDPESLPGNDNNGKLGTGEHAFLYVKLVNDGPDLEGVTINLEGPKHPGLSIKKSMEKGPGFGMETGKPVEARFEIELPPDYLSPSIELLVEVAPDYLKNKWDKKTSLEVDVKGQFETTFKLFKPDGTEAKPEDIYPGAELEYRLELKNTTKGAMEDLELALSSPGLSMVPKLPNQFSGQGFKGSETKTYTGKLTIPKEFKKDRLVVLVEISNASGTQSIYKKELIVELGAQATVLILEPTPPPKGQTAWKISIQVKTEVGEKPVDEGVVVFKKLETGLGKLSKTEVAVTKGTAEITWTPPKDFSDQALIEAEYSGDQNEPDKKDEKFLPSTASLILPPGETTRVKVEAKPKGKPEENSFEISIKVVDGDDKLIDKGVLEITSNLGTLSGHGLKPKGGKIKLTGKASVLTWKGPKDLKKSGKAVFSYSGDQIKPEKVDEKYGPSEAELLLPPEQQLKEHIEYYKNGNKRLYYTYYGDRPHEVKHGEEIQWYENGQKLREERFRGGKWHGNSNAWYENGQKEWQGNRKDGEHDGKWIKWDRSGQKTEEMEYKGGKRYDGWYIYYESHGTGAGEGQTELYSKEKYTLQDGVQHGESILWRRWKGKWIKAREGNFKKGKKYGKWIEWYIDDGQKLREDEFRDGKRHGICIYWDKYLSKRFKRFESSYKEGKRHGESMEWYDNGQKEEEGNYKEDKKHGKWVSWDRNGDMISAWDFEEGKNTGNGVIYRYNNKKFPYDSKEEIVYKDRKKHGKYIAWHKREGKLIKAVEGSYKEDKEHGKWISWQADGRKSKEENFRGGKRHGKIIHWYGSGKKSSESNYKNGKQDGKSVSWNENGQKWHEGNYKEGKMHGKQIWWDDKGEKTREENYRDGKRLD